MQLYSLVILIKVANTITYFSISYNFLEINISKKGIAKIRQIIYINRLITIPLSINFAIFKYFIFHFCLYFGE
jgi:hypothetical protein